MPDQVTLGSEDRVHLAPGLVERRVGGQIFVLMPDSTMHIFENDTAVHLYDRLADAADAGASVSELSESLVQEFQVDAPTAVGDVVEFVTNLLAQHVVRLRDGDEP